MDLSIYEDQDGAQYYPPGKSNRNPDVVKLFNKEIHLFVKKERSDITIKCMVYASKASGRNEGYYVVYQGKYEPDIFKLFKKETKLAFEQIGYNISTSDDNWVYNKINQLDEFSGKYNSFLKIILSAINFGDKLHFTSRNPDEISDFCGILINNISDIDIYLSQRKNISMGSVNIALDSMNEDVTPTRETKGIIDRHEFKIFKNYISNKLPHLSSKNKEDINSLLFEDVLKNKLEKEEYTLNLLRRNHSVDWNKLWKSIPKEIKEKHIHMPPDYRSGSSLSDCNRGFNEDYFWKICFLYLIVASISTLVIIGLYFWGGYLSEILGRLPI